MNIFNWARWKLLSLSATGLLILAFFIWQGELAIAAEKLFYLNNPQKFKGKEICVSYINVVQKSPGGVIGRDMGGKVYHLQLNSPDILINERYSFKGIIKSDGKIQVSSFQHHPFRVLKYILSALSLAIVLYLIVIHIRFEESVFLLSVRNLHKGVFAARKGIDPHA
jgi:hypothetical protein